MHFIALAVVVVVIAAIAATLTMATLAATIMIVAIVPSVIAISDPDQRSARDFAPGHSDIGDPNAVGPGNLKKVQEFPEEGE